MDTLSIINAALAPIICLSSCWWLVKKLDHRASSTKNKMDDDVFPSIRWILWGLAVVMSAAISSNALGFPIPGVNYLATALGGAITLGLSFEVKNMLTILIVFWTRPWNLGETLIINDKEWELFDFKGTSVILKSENNRWWTLPITELYSMNPIIDKSR